jgi:nucleoside-diphosphate-sugar epimerase
MSALGPGEKVLVTGGRGFLGSHLCRRLLNCGVEVHATSRHPQSQQHTPVKWWQADLEDISAVRDLLATTKPDVIYHLAGSVGASPSLELVLPTFHSLLLSTVNLLTAVAETGCRRIILTGSLTEPHIAETEPIPGSPYAASKWAANAYGRMFHELFATPCVTVRPFMTYGPGQDPRKIIPAVILSFLKGEAPRVSSGRWEADWVYVDDVIEGLLKVALVPKIDGATIDLGSGRLVSVQTIVEQLTGIVGNGLKPLFGALPDRPLEQVRVADIVDTHAKLGWKASTSLDDGLKQTVEWYRGQAVRALH